MCGQSWRRAGKDRRRARRGRRNTSKGGTRQRRWDRAVALFFCRVQCRRASPGAALGLSGRKTLGHVERRLWNGCKGGIREGETSKVGACTYSFRIAFFCTRRRFCPAPPARTSRCCCLDLLLLLVTPTVRVWLCVCEFVQKQMRDGAKPDIQVRQAAGFRSSNTLQRSSSLPRVFRPHHPFLT